jgi:hypothetical protein
MAVNPRHLADVNPNPSVRPLATGTPDESLAAALGVVVEKVWFCRSTVHLLTRLSLVPVNQILSLLLVHTLTSSLCSSTPVVNFVNKFSKFFNITLRLPES